MIKKVTYQDKVKVKEEGAAINTWRDVDANEVKTAVNDNADIITGIRMTGTATFKRLGQWLASPTTPHNTTITVDKTDAIDTAVIGIWYKGAVITKDSFVGAGNLLLTGTNVENEICIVWMVYDMNSNSFAANIQVGVSEVVPGNPPQAPSLSLSQFTIGSNPPLEPSLSLSQYTIGDAPLEPSLSLIQYNF